jgi:hypothetical protein
VERYSAYWGRAEELFVPGCGRTYGVVMTVMQISVPKTIYGNLILLKCVLKRKNITSHNENQRFAFRIYAYPL